MTKSCALLWATRNSLQLPQSWLSNLPCLVSANLQLKTTEITRVWNLNNWARLIKILGVITRLHRRQPRCIEIRVLCSFRQILDRTLLWQIRNAQKFKVVEYMTQFLLSWPTTLPSSVSGSLPSHAWKLAKRLNKGAVAALMSINHWQISLNTLQRDIQCSRTKLSVEWEALLWVRKMKKDSVRHWTKLWKTQRIALISPRTRASYLTKWARRSLQLITNPQLSTQ